MQSYKMKTGWVLAMLATVHVFGQKKSALQDTSHPLEEVRVKGYRTVNGVGRLSEVKEGVVYAGKKTEVLLVDSLDANKAVNNTRQILGRIPGLTIVETESSGFTANGIASRGLNPNQSIEMNTRQNGYNISADVYGYNEAYYLPPMEAVRSIELVRGAASLQFGPQFGGTVNYVTEDAPADKLLQYTTAQTIGSFGTYNSFHSIGGTKGKWSYYSYYQERHIEGYRPNSQQVQRSGFAKLKWAPSDRLKLAIEYSLLRNRIQMPGGLSDAMFLNDPKASFRARNWLKSPWNILAFSLDYRLTEKITVAVKSALLLGNRSLVWRNEDGGPAVYDSIESATGQQANREVGNEEMKGWTTEIRTATEHGLLGEGGTLACGARVAFSQMKRQGGGIGTTGSDFDLSHTGPWGYDLDYTTFNFAPFLENIIRIGRHLTVTPGLRYEYLSNTAKGYETEDPFVTNSDKRTDRNIFLTGIGAEWKPRPGNGLYANITRCYRPVEYAQLSPFGTNSKIDPNLRDPNGFNADLGFRAQYGNAINLDLGLFYLAYNDRIGVVVKKDPATGSEYGYRTNIANSAHKGAETYIEANLSKLANPNARSGISVFNSFAYIDARYLDGEFKGKRVEAASKTVDRVGISYKDKAFSATFQYSFTGDAFGDASNVMESDDPLAGYIPAYDVMDLSASYRIGRFSLKAGANNLADKHYFTRRTDEYPGPGIIPAVGRSFYIGFSAKF